jgi:hypothetical protein
VNNSADVGGAVGLNQWGKSFGNMTIIDCHFENNVVSWSAG